MNNILPLNGREKMNIFEWGSSWLNSEMSLFYGIQVIKMLCLVATAYFCSNGLLILRKGWHSDNRQQLSLGISSLLCGFIFFAGFFRVLFF
jgi:hypothetical protein